VASKLSTLHSLSRRCVEAQPTKLLFSTPHGYFVSSWGSTPRPAANLRIVRTCGSTRSRSICETDRIETPDFSASSSCVRNA
jgi:hypothetical protein